MKTPVFSFKTLGCRLNQAEEERLRRQVLEAGFYISEPRAADFCVVNTCSVTALADKKSHQAIRQLRAQCPGLKALVVIGCGAEKAKDYPEVDLWIPNSQKSKTLEIIISNFKVLNQLETDNFEKTIQTSKFKHQNSGRTRALLKVQDGCNNFCAYCIVPYLRGREVSYDPKGVVAEAKTLEGLGYKELVISGVNVGRYSYKRSQKAPVETLESEFEKSETQTKLVTQNSKIYLIDLLKMFLAETDFPRIRLSSINPQDINDELIDLWSSEPRLCNHFHLSLQSGANNVLKNMGRPYTREQYLKLCKKIIQKIPEMAITTDVIVGFPGETDQDFADTVELVKEAKLAKLHVFRYSKRTGTRASEFSEQINDAVKKERSQKLIEIGQKLEQEFKNQFIGQKLEVLFEEQKKGFWYGLTDNYIRVKIKSEENLENQFKKIVLKKEYLA